MDSSNSSIGKRIKTLRKKKDYSQVELGTLINLDDKIVSKMERGLRNFSVDELLLLSDIFHCSTDYLIKGSEFKSVDSELPETIVATLLYGSCEQKELLKSYLNMFETIRNMNQKD